MNLNHIGMRPLHDATYARLNSVTPKDVARLIGFQLGEHGLACGRDMARHIVNGTKDDFLGLVKWQTTFWPVTNSMDVAKAMGEEDQIPLIIEYWKQYPQDYDGLRRLMTLKQPRTILALNWASEACYYKDQVAETGPKFAAFMRRTGNRGQYQYSAILEVREQDVRRADGRDPDQPDETCAGQELVRFHTDVRAPGLIQLMTWELKDAVEDVFTAITQHNRTVALTDVPHLLRLEALRERKNGVTNKYGNTVYPLYTAGDDLNGERTHFTPSSVPWLQYMHAKLNNPAYVQVLNMLPPDPEQGGRPHRAIPSELQDNMLAETSMALLAEKWGFDMNSWALDILAKRLFSHAIDFAAYSTGFMAATLSEGYHSGVNVIIKDIGMGTDGSSRAHPKCGIWKQGDIVSPRQWRGVIPVVKTASGAAATWLFYKGIVVPDEACLDEAGNPAIFVDRSVLKGDCKSWKFQGKQFTKTGEGVDIITNLKQHQMTGRAWFSVINKWDRPGWFRWSFEVLENLADNERTRTSVTEFVQEAFEDLRGQGVKGLLGMVAGSDESMRMILRMVERINELALQYKRPDMMMDPLEISRVREAAKDKLGRWLYTVGQGSGMRSSQYVMVMDHNVKRGTCVVAGYEPGTPLSCFRYPVVLAQGLQILHVAKAHPHHKVAGKVIPFTVFLNPEDTVECFMGDDDGDVLAICSERRVIDLFKHRIDDRVFMIEPAGSKHAWKTLSPDGLMYCRRDPRGPVGRMTIHRASMLAYAAKYPELYPVAISMSLMVQEAIDQAKRMVRFSDWRLAADLNNWTQDDQGRYWFRQPVVENGVRVSDDPKQWTPIELPYDLYEPGVMPEQLIQTWLDDVTDSLGVEGNALAWRDLNYGSADKRVLPDELKHIPASASGYNLVHHAWNAMVDEWFATADEFNMEREVRSLSGVLVTLLDLKFPGHNWNHFTPTAQTWEHYKKGSGGGMVALRKRAGLTDYSSGWSKLLDATLDIDERGERASRLGADLDAALSQLSPLELLEVWFWESQDPRDILSHEAQMNGSNRAPQSFSAEEIREFMERRGGPNLSYAIRAVSFPGSPLMKLLEIDSFSGCDYFRTQQGLERLRVYGDFMFADELGMKFRADSSKYIQDTTKPDLLQRRQEAQAFKRALHEAGFNVLGPVDRLVHLIKHDDGHHAEEAGRFNPDDSFQKLIECPDCMKLIQDEFIRRQRSLRSPDTEYLTKIISTLNGMRIPSAHKFGQEWFEWADKLSGWQLLAERTDYLGRCCQSIQDVDLTFDRDDPRPENMGEFERTLWDFFVGVEGRDTRGTIYENIEGVPLGVRKNLRELARRTSTLMGDRRIEDRWKKALNPTVHMGFDQSVTF